MRPAESLIDPAQLADLRLPAGYAELRRQAMAYILQRRSNICTTGQVQNHLKKHAADPLLTARVIADLAADGYVDDLRAARAVIKTRQGRRAESRGLLLRRMLRLGVPRGAAERALSEMIADEPARIEAYLEARHAAEIDALRSGSLDAGQRLRLRKRILAAAGRRGFSPGLVRPALDRAVSRSVRPERAPD